MVSFSAAPIATYRHHIIRTGVEGDHALNLRQIDRVTVGVVCALVCAKVQRVTLVILKWKRVLVQSPPSTKPCHPVSQ